MSVNVSKMIQESEPKIEPKDLLNIRVTTLSIESNAIFNNVINVDVFNTTTPQLIKMGYRVGKDGDISFPVLGEVEVGGLTISEAEEVMARKLSAYTKNPIVNIDFLNFKVTVIGEVTRPGTFTVADENVTLLGALGYAGDLTPFAKRNNVLIVREVSGVRTTGRINLNSNELFTSPYYYLKQNDIIYVEPDKSKVQQTDQDNRYIPIIGSFMTVVAVIVGLAFRK
ncbi:polysaccharide biosynthesis/export family protein [Mucilaginibacter panaciglaebae]|uniref:Polysaccharide biosynthesis/export family protein n=2 Tax=Mucilaginibacter panaciglaebae TaxID=502331 RepID=A0ABP7WE60_9SPHI